VQEISVSGDAPAGATANLPFPYSMILGTAGTTAPETGGEPRVSSPTLAAIPVQVKLLVRFAIEPGDPATAQN
jgi:hypothetical protein